MIDKSTITIMVLDDDPLILRLHKRVLHTLGYDNVTTCDNALHALETMDILAAQPDLILLDLNMPDMDGVEFVRYLVKRDYSGSLILLSMEDERVLQATEKLVRAHKMTILGHMRKPVKQEGLEKLLQKWAPNSAPRLSDTGKVYSAEEVRAATLSGQLLNYYQPKVSLATGHVVGAETLVRWNHPSDGLIMPQQFIDVAEEHGLIGDITRAVVDQALVQARVWTENGLNLHMAINVSMDDLGSLDFVDYIAGKAAIAGVPPQQVTLEVTESRLMQDLRISLEVLTRLRLKRFRLSIDDFGTGHSSLAQLRDIPFDELKIDRGFVHGTWADETIRAIFDTSALLARQLNMGIVAEGVEDRADWDFVSRSGCDLAQGYFIAKPMPAEELRDWMEDWEERFLSLSRNP